MRSIRYEVLHSDVFPVTCYFIKPKYYLRDRCSQMQLVYVNGVDKYVDSFRVFRHIFMHFVTFLSFRS